MTSKLKILLWTFVLMMLVSCVSALTVSNFTNGLTEENITLAASVAVGRHVQLPDYSTATSAYLDLEGKSSSNTTTYQEWANQTTGCTSNICYDTGSYNSTSTTLCTYSDVDAMSDGDFDTSSVYDCTGALTGNSHYYYENYTMPLYSTSATIKYKYYRFTSTHTDYYTLPSSCMDRDYVTLRWRFREFVESHRLNLEYECGAGWVEIDELTITNTVYEMAINWTYNQYPYLMEFKAGQGVRPFESGAIFYNTSNTTSNFNTNLNTALNDGNCNCSGCVNSGDYCNIPLYFTSGTVGIVEYSNIEINYTLNAANITINLLDAETTNPINWSNITVQFVGNFQQNETLSDTGATDLLYYINESNVADTITIRAFSEDVTDYSIVSRILNVTQGVDVTYNIYLTNTSDTTTTDYVTLQVRDEDRNSLENATIFVQRQDPATNTFISVADLKTNPNGQATMLFVLDTVFYKFLVDYKGNRIYTSAEAIPISTNDDIIYLNAVLGGSFVAFYETVVSANVGLTYSNVTNSSGRFIATYTSTTSNLIETCLKVTQYNSSGNHTLNYTCENGTSGTMTSMLLSPTLNVTLYAADVFIDVKDGYGKRWIKSLQKWIGIENVQNLGTTSLIIVLAVIVVAAFGLIVNPLASLAFMILGFGIIAKTNLTLIGTAGFVYVIAFCMFSMIVLYDFRKK